MNCSLNSLYLCVDDMNRAIEFYETLLEQKVKERDAVYSVFCINGFRLGLFAYQKMKEEHSFGSNCLPSLEFENLTILRQKIKENQVVFPLTKIGKNWVAEIKDSEGNHLELTAPAE